MEATSVLVIIVAAASPVALGLSYRSMRAPFFLYLLFAGLALACAASASYFGAYPPAEALADLGLAIFGVILAAASHQLLTAFRQAGEDRD